jgi:hypothetical protein
VVLLLPQLQCTLLPCTHLVHHALMQQCQQPNLLLVALLLLLLLPE